jgi:quercetin dioxygenase-like cupin family protein
VTRVVAARAGDLWQDGEQFHRDALPVDTGDPTWLDPGASIGWHLHEHTEEIYYLLTGSLTVTVQDRSLGVHVLNLGPGDSHRIGTGRWHDAVAGPDGGRFLCVILAAPAASATTEVLR